MRSHGGACSVFYKYDERLGFYPAAFAWGRGIPKEKTGRPTTP